MSYALRRQVDIVSPPPVHTRQGFWYVLCGLGQGTVLRAGDRVSLVLYLRCQSPEGPSTLRWTGRSFVGTHELVCFAVGEGRARWVIGWQQPQETSRGGALGRSRKTSCYRFRGCSSGSGMISSELVFSVAIGFLFSSSDNVNLCKEETREGILLPHT